MFGIENSTSEIVWVALKRAVCMAESMLSLSSFSSDSACQLDVFWHDGDALGVDCAKVGVFEEADQVRFAGFLQRHY